MGRDKNNFRYAIISTVSGAVAQLGERLACTEEVRSSSLLSSTKGVVILLKNRLKPALRTTMSTRPIPGAETKG